MSLKISYLSRSSTLESLGFVIGSGPHKSQGRATHVSVAGYDRMIHRPLSLNRKCADAYRKKHPASLVNRETMGNRCWKDTWKAFG